MRRSRRSPDFGLMETLKKRLLEMRELADNDGVYGYAGIKPSGVSDGEMISSE